MNPFEVATYHVVSEDAVQAHVVEGYHPVERVNLVRLELASCQHARLLSHSHALFSVVCHALVLLALVVFLLALIVPGLPLGALALSKLTDYSLALRFAPLTLAALLLSSLASSAWRRSAWCSAPLCAAARPAFALRLRAVGPESIAFAFIV